MSDKKAQVETVLKKQLIDVITVMEEDLNKTNKKYSKLGYFPEFTIKEIKRGSFGFVEVKYLVRVFKIVEREKNDK